MRNQEKLITNGVVKINGYQISNVSQLAAISGYVQQDDLFIGTLKVEEHLKFQVKRKLSNFVFLLSFKNV